MTDETTAAPHAHDAPSEPAPHRPTLMTVHAHPDDETIGTGGAMAKAVAAGHRVVLVTGTRGEMGEIVVPDMDTPENHRRLGEIRAVELERAMAILGVTEWENLGYRDSDMMGRPGNLDPRNFWKADLDDAAGRLTWLIRRYQPDVITTYNEFGGYGHPDHIRVHDVVDPGVRARRRSRVVSGAAGRGRRRDRGRRRSSTSRPSRPRSARRWRRGSRSSARRRSGSRPRTRPPSRSPSSRRTPRRCSSRTSASRPGSTSSGDPLQRKWDAIHEHVTQISDQSPFMLLGLDGWREGWAQEAYILRESRVETTLPETDLFAGIA